MDTLYAIFVNDYSFPLARAQVGQFLTLFRGFATVLAPIATQWQSFVWKQNHGLVLA
jgi:hypothetical protein